MEEFISLKNAAKLGKVKKRKKKKKTYKNDFIVVKNEIVEDKGGVGAAKILKQSKNENEHQFINRLQRMADKAIAEAKVEEKYNIKLVSVDKDGNAKYKSLDDENNETKKTQKRKKYRERLKEKKKLKADDKEFEFKKDHIPFGDVVMAPPTLSAKSRSAFALPKKNQEIQKPQNDRTNEAQSSLVTTKMKDMTPDRRKELENERSRAVQMYRLLKSKKYSLSS
ncbi:coiled-coil domain-containing protein 137 [Parasteatoda tepidariorum]|uniref:coiled-coil domain-containing protein 137 n=1 Tax=Parasteatoda tepidariorum TaxID=114398 RepID=UPI001C71CD0A|nr:coiled-coil domain-containing protein 137 [Parasteatoda tepidariorum]